jgi:hypothetical protein
VTMTEYRRPSITNLARLLVIAAKKHNESADAACSVAVCLERSDGDLSDQMVDAVFETVTDLAGISLEHRPNYRRAARDLIEKLARRTALPGFRKHTNRK